MREAIRELSNEIVIAGLSATILWKWIPSVGSEWGIWALFWINVLFIPFSAVRLIRLALK